MAALCRNLQSMFEKIIASRLLIAQQVGARPARWTANCSDKYLYTAGFSKRTSGTRRAR